MRTERSNILLLILLNLFVTILFFYPILGHLNSILLSAGGDGIKNYFTYLYFITYDKGIHFTGMNYPFGEHMVFTDNMPAFAWTIAQIKTLFPGIVNYALLIMHSSFIISYFLASVFIYKTLKMYNVKGWWTVVSAVFIAYFSPQFLRLFGHYGLGLTCYLPMLIFWINKYSQLRQKKYLLYISICSILFTFFHVYHLAFGLVLIGAYSFSSMIVSCNSFRKRVMTIVPLILSVLLSVAIFKIFINLTDTVTDRPKFPIGFLGAGVTGADILTSDYNFIGKYVFSWLFGEASSSSEGYVYLGLITILVSFCLIYRVIRSIFFRIKEKVKLPVHPVRSYRVWLVTAFIVLLFSMGVPFVWGMEFLIDYFSTFRQFRTIGRFAWIFYYIMMMYATIVIYRLVLYLKYKRYSWQPVALLSCIIVVYFIELNGYAQKLTSGQAGARNNYFDYFAKGGEDWKEWFSRQGYPSGYFQAAIGLPYFHIGSEKLGLQNNGNDYTLYYGSQISMHAGLPMTDVMMSRTSWSQTFESVRLYDGPFSDKSILKRMDKRPFLLFVNTFEQLLPGERSMLTYARPIGNRSGLDLYELDISLLEQGYKRYLDSVKMIAASYDTKEGLMGRDSVFYYCNHFDQEKTKTSLWGRGSFMATQEKKQLLDSITVAHYNNDTAFVISVWMYWYEYTTFFPSIIYEQYDKTGKKIIQGDILPGKSTYVTGNWYKMESLIHIKPETVMIQLWAVGNHKSYKAIDELMIIPVNTVYYYKPNDSMLVLNNRPIMLK